MTGGSILLLVMVAALIAIGIKVKGNTQKLEELEDLLSKK